MADERERFPWGELVQIEDGDVSRACTACGFHGISIERIKVKGDPLGRLYVRCWTHTRRRQAHG